MSRVYKKDNPTSDQLKRYADDIPYKYYECMELIAEGHAYASIADMLVIPIGTVKSRISRGKIKYKRLEEARINNEKKTALQHLGEDTFHE